MFEFPQYEDDGSELLAFENTWREIQPQEVLGADCFNPYATVDNDENKLILVLTGLEFRRMFSALYNGALITYPQEFLQIIVNFLKGLHCPPEMEDEAGCINFFPYASFVEFLEQNPYNEPDLIPEGYAAPPFLVNTDFDYPALLGYIATDVMVKPESVPVFGDWGDLIALHFPTIVLHVSGVGQIEVDFLNVLLGGQVIIKVGGAPNILDLVDGIFETGVRIVDLGQDVTALPPESDIIIAEEIPINAPEGTDVYFVFIPKLDISTEFFGMGGGIRNIGLCGLETEAAMTGIEDIRYAYGGAPEDTFRPYVLEKREGGIWTPVELGTEEGVMKMTTLQIANDAKASVWALRNIDEYSPDINFEDAGWLESPIKAYIDAHEGTPFDANYLEEAIDILDTQVTIHDEDIDDLQAELEGVEANIVTMQSAIDVLDARLDVLEGQQMWSQAWDFKIDNYDFSEASPATWTIGLGFEFEDDMAVTKADSSFLDGRVAYYRLEIRNLEATEIEYTSRLEGQVASYGVLEVGLNIRYHKLENVATREDLTIEIVCGTGLYQLEGLTLYGWGNNNWDDD